MSSTTNSTTHRVAIHKHTFGYRVDPGRLRILRGEGQHLVVFTNYTDNDISLEFPPGLFREAEKSVALSPFKGAVYTRELTLAAEEGDFEYRAIVTAAGIEAEGTSRPRILVER